jgi:protein SCO1
MASKLPFVFAASLMLIAGVAGAIWIETNRSDGAAAAASGIGGPFSLTATNGAVVTDQSLRGKWLLIYFGYTFCPDACPTALSNISAALVKLGARAQRVQPLFITIDPRRDTRETMAKYMKSFDPRILGLTGSAAALAVVAREFGVFVAPQKAEGDDYLIDHSSFIYVMNPQGRFAVTLAGNLPGAKMAARLEQLMSSNS